MKSHQHAIDYRAKDMGLVTISTPQEILSAQNLPYFIGISSRTTGAKNISMNIVIIPPGGAAEPHYHAIFETGIYLIQGEVETFFGNDLEQSVINKAGDFLFIPPNIWHQPKNLSSTEEARAIVVRNDAHEREAVIHDKPTPV